MIHIGDIEHLLNGQTNELEILQGYRESFESELEFLRALLHQSNSFATGSEQQLRQYLHDTARSNRELIKQAVEMKTELEQHREYIKVVQDKSDTEVSKALEIAEH
jgi:hypothetical protein